MGAKVLVAFISTDGQTRKVAEYITAGLRSGGCDVTVRDVRTMAAERQVSQFDACYIGGAVRFGRHHWRLAKYMSRFRYFFEARRSVLFSVSEAAADRRFLNLAEQYVAKFLKKTRCDLSDHICVAGARKYKGYNVLTRSMLNMMHKRKGVPSNTNRNGEMTNWQSIDEFISIELRILSRKNMRRVA